MHECGIFVLVPTMYAVLNVHDFLQVADENPFERASERLAQALREKDRNEPVPMEESPVSGTDQTYCKQDRNSQETGYRAFVSMSNAVVCQGQPVLCMQGGLAAIHGHANTHICSK